MSCCCAIPACLVRFKGKTDTSQKQVCGSTNFDGVGVYQTYTKIASGSVSCTRDLDPGTCTKTLTSTYGIEIDYSGCGAPVETPTGSTTESQSGGGDSDYSTTTSNFPSFSSTLTEDSATRRVFTSVEVENCEACGVNAGTWSGTLTITEEYSDEATAEDICGVPATILVDGVWEFITPGASVGDMDIDVSAGTAVFNATEYGLYFEIPASCSVHAEWDEVLRNDEGAVINTTHRTYDYTGSCTPDTIIDPEFGGAFIGTAGVECSEEYNHCSISLENLVYHCKPS